MHADPVPTMIGPYRVVRALGAGGWSTVYEVVAPNGLTYALKRLRANLPESALARFRREADSLRRIAHPGVLRLVDVGSDGGAPYLVMPRVDGPSLRELLAGGPLGIEGALLIATGAAEALGAIHAAGLVHRDVKPENLMLTATGDVVVIDLGLALGPEHSRHTEENALTGSVPYMAPEQIEDRAPTPASDVWALAVVLYEATLGRRPFQRARQSEEVAAILAGKHEPLAAADPRCPDELSALLTGCLNHSPDRRPTDGTTLARALAAHLDWLSHGPAELAAARTQLALDPRRYAASVAPVRAARAAAAARTALAAGDAFTAGRHVERALALQPDDPALLQLLDAVLSGAGRVPPPSTADAGATLVGFQPARPSAGHRVAARPAITASGERSRPRRRTSILIGIAALVALAATIVILLVSRSGESSKPVSAPDTANPTTRPAHVEPSRGAAVDPDDEPPATPAKPASDGTIEKPASVKPSQPAKSD